MKLKIINVALAVAIIACSPASGLVITNFGNSSFTIDSIITDFTTINQTSSSINVIGTDMQILAGYISTVDISSYTTFTLTGSISGTNPNTQFKFEFFDSSFNNRVYLANTSSFGTSPSVVTLVFNSSHPSFDPSNVIGLQYSGVGAGDTINLTLSSLDAIPEPATWALFALGLTGLAVFSNRKKGNLML